MFEYSKHIFKPCFDYSEIILQFGLDYSKLIVHFKYNNWYIIEDSKHISKPCFDNITSWTLFDYSKLIILLKPGLISYTYTLINYFRIPYNIDTQCVLILC